jgi:uncharacterized membrane protein YfcA
VTVAEIAAAAAAGGGAGAANAVAGAGSLITFPTLVALGIPALSANVTSTVGLVPGAVGGAIGYRAEVRHQRRRIVWFVVPMLVGAAIGTALLLITSNATFELVVPVLVAGSCLLLLLQPRLAQRLTRHGSERSPLFVAGLTGAGAYAAYFGSAVGIMLIALLTLFVDETVQRLNAVKIVLAGLANLLAACVYAFLAPVNWEFAVTLMVSSLIGGQLGAHGARRISGDTLRVGIAIAGLVIAVVLGVEFYGG